MKSTSEDNKVRKLGYHTAGVATSVLFAKIASLIVTGLAFVLVSRLLGPTTYGVYVLAVAFAGVFTYFGILGIDTALPKFVAEYKSKGEKRKLEEVVSSAYVTILVMGVVLTIIAIAFGGLISQFIFKSSAYYNIVVIASLSIALSMLYGISYAALVGFGRKGFLVKLTLVQVMVQSVLSIALVLLGFGALAPIIGFIAGLVAGTLIAIMSIYSQEKLELRMPESASIRALLVFSLPIGVYSAVSGVVSNLANLILGFFASKAIVGNVGVALRFGSVMSLAVDSVGIALLPLFASLTDKQHTKHTNRLYNYSVYLVLAILAPIIAAICVVSWNITIILWPNFTSLPYLIPIVSIGVIFTMLGSYTATILISKNKVRELMKYSLLVSVSELVLLFLFVPVLRGLGLVAIASLFAPLLSFVLYIRLAGRLIGLKLEYGKIMRIFAASLITAAVIAPLPFIFMHSSIITLALTIVVLVVVYPPLVSMLNGLTEKDLTVVKGISHTMPGVGLLLSPLADYALRHKKK